MAGVLVQIMIHLFLHVPLSLTELIDLFMHLSYIIRIIRIQATASAVNAALVLIIITILSRQFDTGLYWRL